MSDTGSILTQTKKYIGFEESYDAFDPDIVMFINAAFGNIHQVMNFPDKPFIINDKTATWKDFSSDEYILSTIKMYIWSFVRMSFDPPETSFSQTAMKDIHKELEWRLSVVGEKESHV